jgi:hypothetical protein
MAVGEEEGRVRVGNRWCGSSSDDVEWKGDERLQGGREWSVVAAELAVGGCRVGWVGMLG